MTNEMVAKIKDLKNDEAFVKMLFEQDTPEKIQAAFKSKDIDLTLDEVKDLIKFVIDAAEKEKTDELNEEALEDVNGGAITLTIIGGCALVGLMTVAGGAIGWWAAGKKC